MADNQQTTGFSYVDPSNVYQLSTTKRPNCVGNTCIPNRIQDYGNYIPSIEQIAARNYNLITQSPSQQTIPPEFRQNNNSPYQFNQPNQQQNPYNMQSNNNTSSTTSDMMNMPRNTTSSPSPSMPDMTQGNTSSSNWDMMNMTQNANPFFTPTPATTMNNGATLSTVITDGNTSNGTQTPLVSDFANPYPVTAESVQYLNGFIRTQIGRRVTIDFLIGSNNMVSKSGYLLGAAADYILINELDTNDLTTCDFYNIKFIRFYYD